MDNRTLIKQLALRTGRSTKEVENLLEGFISIVKERGADMDSIAIPGFGVFEPKKRLERINVHPATGKRILIPPKISLTFKMSAVLKQKLREVEVK